MTMPSPARSTSWRVTGQIAYTDVTASGQPVKGKNVTILTGNGQEATVFIPDVAYANLGTVRSILSQAAEHADAVAAMTSDNAIGT